MSEFKSFKMIQNCSQRRNAFQNSSIKTDSSQFSNCFKNWHSSSLVAFNPRGIKNLLWKVDVLMEANAAPNNFQKKI